MKSMSEWFAEYSVSHQNSKNQIIHKICVPAIFWSVVALLYHLLPIYLCSAILILALVFYFRLGIKPGAVMTTQILLSLWLAYFIQTQTRHLLITAFLVFVLAWIGQFVGHKIEGRKPSFFQDLQFLLIGPLWVLKGIIF